MYELFYGLNVRPFRMSPDLECFCLTQPHKRALVHLRYALQQAEGFVVLSGDPGTGKTLLSQVMMKELELQNIRVASIGNAVMEESDLLPALLKAFGKPIFEYKLRALVSQLEAFLLSNAEAGQRTVIVIDEAQNLSQRSLEILRLLSNLQFQNHAVLQVVLVGDKCLEENMSAQENHLLFQRVVLNYQLNTLEIDDTKKYILHRLRHAGWQDNPEIHEDVYFIVQHLSKGFPTEINRYFDRLLMQGMLRNRHQITVDDVGLLLNDDNKYEQQENISYNLPIQKTIIDIAADEKEMVSETLHKNTKTEASIENSFVHELEKELEMQVGGQEEVFKSPAEKNYSGTFSTLLLSYSASLILALLLFYSGTDVLVEKLVNGIEHTTPVQSINRPHSSVASTD